MTQFYGTVFHSLSNRWFHCVQSVLVFDKQLKKKVKRLDIIEFLIGAIILTVTTRPVKMLTIVTNYLK